MKTKKQLRRALIIAKYHRFSENAQDRVLLEVLMDIRALLVSQLSQTLKNKKAITRMTKALKDESVEDT